MSARRKQAKAKKRPELRTIDLLVPASKLAEVAKRQRNYVLAIAQRLEAGEDLPPVDKSPHRVIVAGIVRAFAQSIPDVPKRRAGQAPKIDAGAVALKYSALVASGTKPSHALARLAEEHEVSEQTIKNARGKYGKVADAMTATWRVDLMKGKRFKK